MAMLPSIETTWALVSRLAPSGHKCALELLEPRLDSAHQVDKRLLLLWRQHLKPLLLSRMQALEQFVHDTRTEFGNLDQEHAPVRGVRHASHVAEFFEHV